MTEIPVAIAVLAIFLGILLGVGLVLLIDARAKRAVEKMVKPGARVGPNSMRPK